jgi:prevent-host-death family protein
VTEVTLTELGRRTASVVDRVRRGEVGVVTKHGRPVAMILPILDRETLVPAAVDEMALGPLAERFADRENERRWWELLHGRWYNGHGFHGEYPSKRRRRRVTR